MKEEKRELSPENPQHAVEIIDVLTKDLKISRRELEIFQTALNTLFMHFNEKTKKDD